MLRTYLGGAAFGTTAGHGAPRALLLHGWRRGKEDFSACAELLADAGVASLAIDLPGFGSSPPPAMATGARGYATQLAPLVAELARDGGPLLVVGHSFGGRIGVCLAAGSPTDVAGAVLTGVPLIRDLLPRPRVSRRFSAIRALGRRGLVSPKVVERARSRYGSADYRAASGVMRDVLVALVNESYEDELRRLQRPVTLLWGSRDAVVPPDVARAAAGLSERLRVQLLEGVGHLVPTEAPGPLCEAATSMLEESH